MNSIKEIWESLTERFKNPLVHAFIISWCLINYKIILVILSGENFAFKIKFIESTIYPNGIFDMKNIIINPAISASLYIFVVPAFSLITTWTNAIYDRLHSDLRAKQARIGILTKAQRERLEEEVADLNNRIRLDAQHHAEALKTAEQRISVIIDKFSERTLKGHFLMLQESAEEWGAHVIKPPQGRTIKGGGQYQEFVQKHGIPVSWARVFEKINHQGTINSTELASYLSITDTEALDILIGLSSLTMLRPTWNNGDLRFHLVESSWVALLNGRPA